MSVRIKGLGNKRFSHEKGAMCGPKTVVVVYVKYHIFKRKLVTILLTIVFIIINRW